jgi:predicted RNase H-like HicB family nuclease
MEEQMKIDFYTTVLRSSGKYWVALCLENGLVGQGISKDAAIKKLREAIESFEESRHRESDVYTVPVSVGELHEFLTVEGKEPTSEQYELRAVNA